MSCSGSPPHPPIHLLLPHPPASLILLDLLLPHLSLFLCLQPKQAWLCFLPHCARAPQPGPSAVTLMLPKVLIQSMVVFTCVAAPDFLLVSLPQFPSHLGVRAHFPEHNLSVPLQSLISRLRYSSSSGRLPLRSPSLHQLSWLPYHSVPSPRLLSQSQDHPHPRQLHALAFNLR